MAVSAPPVASDRPTARPITDHLRTTLAENLRPRLHGTLHIDAMSRALYATDASMYQMEPVAVCIPKTAADVQATLEEAHALNIPVLPRGGGSSLAGQGVNTAVVLDFTRHLDAIVDLDPEAKQATVQPGLVLDRLNQAAAAHGLMVGPDPASSSRATLGGMVANNSTGTHSIRYGNMIHHVRRARGFLADGTPVKFEPLSHGGWQRKMRQDDREGTIYRSLDALLSQHADTIRRDTSDHWRRNNGYRIEALLDTDTRNVAQLMAGSEGTLAVLTEVTIDLVEKPATTVLGIAAYDTRQQALEAVTTLLDTDPDAVELFDGVAIERIRATPGYAERLTFIDGTPGGVLIAEYGGTSKDALASKLDELDAVLPETDARGPARRIQQDNAIANVWSIRKEGLGLVMGVEGEYKPWALIEDASVPVEHLPAYIDELSTLIDELDVRAAYYAHASAGCLHVRPFVNTKTEAGLEQLDTIARGSLDLVKRYGGVTSSEHGDGIVRGALNREMLGDDLYAVNQQVKSIFDPDGHLNPGKVVDAPPLTETLRMGPDYSTRPLRTAMNFEGEGGFAHLLEKCNGNGACRKRDHGTMCPSFMATRKEEDSTRGRANALRSALAGDLPDGAFTGERMHEVMDLCIQCKACKTECPSNVDMAKLKTEWLHQYWQEHRMPLRTRLFAHQPAMARTIAGTPLATAVNWAGRQGWMRKMGEWTLGISAERELPQFARTTAFQMDLDASNPPEGPEVVFFADTFNAYHTPEVVRAAVRFLQRTGHRVRMAPEGLCCGRPLLSKGLVTEAQHTALHTLEGLYPYVEQGLPIVGLEPSCIHTLSDEFLSLLPGELRAKELAEQVHPFEGFVAERLRSGALDPASWGTPTAKELILHGHCHQKALVGTGDTEAILAAAGYDVTTLDTSCCGMAGAFGYEAEHLDISKQMAERRLAPTVREADASTHVAAPGFSCRSQIKDVTPRTAEHPAVLLNKALRG